MSCADAVLPHVVLPYVVAQQCRLQVTTLIFSLVDAANICDAHMLKSANLSGWIFSRY